MINTFDPARCPACGSRNTSGSSVSERMASFDCYDCGSDWDKVERGAGGALVALTFSAQAAAMLADRGLGLSILPCGPGSLACSPSRKEAL